MLFYLMAIFHAGIIVSLVFQVSPIDHPTTLLGKAHSYLFNLYISYIRHPGLILSKDHKVLVQNIMVHG